MTGWQPMESAPLDARRDDMSWCELLYFFFWPPLGIAIVWLLALVVRGIRGLSHEMIHNAVERRLDDTATQQCIDTARGEVRRLEDLAAEQRLQTARDQSYGRDPSAGREFRRLRELTGKSIGDVAREMGVAHALICNVELGRAPFFEGTMLAAAMRAVERDLR